MNLVDMGRTRLLVQHVDVLRRNPLQNSEAFEMLESLMDGPGLKLVESVDELRATVVVDGRITVEPVDVEDTLRILLLVKSLRTPKVRNPAQCRHPCARQTPDMFRLLQRLN